MAFLDGMFSPEDREEAQAKGHMTVDDAAGSPSGRDARVRCWFTSAPDIRRTIWRNWRGGGQTISMAEMGGDLKWYTVPYRKIKMPSGCLGVRPWAWAPGRGPRGLILYRAL